MCTQTYNYVTRPEISQADSFFYLCCSDAKKSHEELKQYISNYEENIIPELGHGEILLFHTDKLMDLIRQVFEDHPGD